MTRSCGTLGEGRNANSSDPNHTKQSGIRGGSRGWETNHSLTHRWRRWSPCISSPRGRGAEGDDGVTDDCCNGRFGFGLGAGAGAGGDLCLPGYGWVQTGREGGSESDGMVDEEQHVVLRGNLWLRLAAAAAPFPSSSHKTKGI